MKKSRLALLAPAEKSSESRVAKNGSINEYWKMLTSKAKFANRILLLLSMLKYENLEVSNLNSSRSSTSTGINGLIIKQ